MARNKSPDPIARTEQADATAVATASQAQDELHQRSTQIAELFGDGLPYDRERLIGMARTYMAASAEAMLEAGKCLVQLKENEPHGEFGQIVERRLGIPARTAQKMMAASVKFLSPALASKAPTLALLGKSKMFELMAEDDGTLAALAEGGTLAGATIDEIDAMSARELRAALRERDQRLGARQRMLDKAQAEVNRLKEADDMRRNGAADEREAAQVDELRDAGLNAELALKQLVAAVDEVLQAPATAAAELQARQTLDFICQRLADLCGERSVSVDLLGERVEPGWVRDIAEAANAAPAAPARKRRA